MYVCLKCILGFTVLFSLGHTYYLCNRTGETWEYAMKHCNRANGTLLSADNYKELDRSMLSKPNVKEFWTSNVIEVAHAIEYKGCFTYTAGISQNNLYPAEGINLVDCQSACNDNYDIYPFYGLYDNKCVCILNEIQINIYPSNQSCFKNCSINSLEFCKDSKLIALYKQIGNESIFRTNVNNKCVVRVNTTASSTENCQKNLQYQCKGRINNGTFLKAIEDCGEDLDHGNEPNYISELFWKPLFFPTLGRIKNQIESKEKKLKMKICKSFKVDVNQVKKRNCTDSLPYICKIEGQPTKTSYLNPCLFPISMTSLPSMKSQLVSTRSDKHASTMPDTSVDNRETNDINYASTSSYIRDTTIQSSSFTDTVDSGLSNKPLLIGISSAVPATILAVIMILIVRKRLSRTKKKNENGLYTVAFQSVANNTEKQDHSNHQNAKPYSLADSVNATLASNQRNEVFVVVDKNNQADNRIEEFYSLATSVSSTSVQNQQKEGRADIYAVVNKNKKEPKNREAQNNTGIDGHVESKRNPGNSITYPLSSGTDYDHLDFRGSGNIDELPGTAGPIYDHAAVGENNAGVIYDVRRDVEQHGADDTYDHALSL